MTGKRVDSSTEEQASGDTIDLEQEPIMETAEFKALVALDEELFGDGEDDEPDGDEDHDLSR